MSERRKKYKCPKCGLEMVESIDVVSTFTQQKIKDLMLSEEEILELILEYASTHPQRDYSIGVKGYDEVPTKKRREENITHWKQLAKAIIQARKEKMGELDVL